MTSEVLRLLERARPAPEAPISAVAIAALPPPAARYLAVARVAGKRPPRTVHLRQSGAMRTAPDKGWFPMSAEEWFSLDPPGFIWRGAIRPNPLLRVSAVDRFVDGHGSMQISAWGKVPMGSVSGPETDSGELLRFLVEIVWFPAFWLSPLVTWQLIDERSARASIRVNGIEVSSMMIFDDGGLPCGIETQRYRTVCKRFELTPWRGRCADYREAHGMLVPHQIAVTWGLPQGDFEWLRASIEQIEYA
ncbi:MAG: DUF6544 family protein [Bryobacteraceae bacterium]|jgi:hypothetical protein